MVRTLEAPKVLKTALKLHARMKERFPDRGITEVAHDVCEVSREAAKVAEHLRRPMIWYRVIAALVILAILAGLVALMVIFQPNEELSFVDLVQTFEAAVNDVIFISLAIFFVVRLERRMKRMRALDLLHKLRSLAHIIDMHQLTKDPSSIASEDQRTTSSPVRDLTAYEVKRYFDYCSEMLAILSKQAALMVQDFDDPVTLNAVNEIENLTSGLSRKIWQKIIVATRDDILPPAPKTES